MSQLHEDSRETVIRVVCGLAGIGLIVLLASIFGPPGDQLQTIAGALVAVLLGALLVFQAVRIIRRR